jgi:uncharacterized protein (TIGR03000 family)
MRRIFGISLIAGALALFAAQPALAQHHGGGHGGGRGGHSGGWHGGTSHSGNWHGGNWGNWNGGRGWYGYGWGGYYPYRYRTWWPGYYSGYYYPSYTYSYPYYGYDSGYYDYGYPSYGGYSSMYSNPTTVVQQPPAVNVNTAQVVVRLPDPNGEVWFDGQKMSSQTGAARSFTTPPLEPGRTYSYQVSAAWHQDGRLVTDERTVNVSAGSAVAVDFGRPVTLRTPIGQQ